MRYVLTMEEAFKDQVELVGVSGAAAAGILVIVYFAMLFFSEAVRLQPFAEKAGILLWYTTVCLTALFIPVHKNWARRLLSVLALGQAVYSAVQWLDQGRWAHVPVLAFAGYVYWVLNHPAAIARFRSLRPPEARQRQDARLLQAVLAVLTVYALVLGWRGIQALIALEPGWTADSLPALGRLLGAAWVLLLAFGLRRLQPWSRWFGAATLALFGLAVLPETFTTRGYLAYWLALGKCIFGLGGAGFLLVAPSVREYFRRSRPGSHSRPGPGLGS